MEETHRKEEQKDGPEHCSTAGVTEKPHCLHRIRSRLVYRYKCIVLMRTSVACGHMKMLYIYRN